MFEEQAIPYQRIKHLLSVFRDSEAKIRPHFFLTGPSGSGKSHMLTSAAKDLDMHVLEINGAQLTGEGYSGNSLSKALAPLKESWQGYTVIFVDEFDKVVQRNGEGTREFQHAVQDEFLRAMEAEKIAVFGDYGKYPFIHSIRTLFVFAGAFSNQDITTIEDLRDAGLRNEFVGRVPLILPAKPVQISSLVEALPEMELLSAYLKLYPIYKKQIVVSDITRLIHEKHKEVEQIGIRLLNSIIHRYFMELQN